MLTVMIGQGGNTSPAPLQGPQLPLALQPVNGFLHPRHQQQDGFHWQFRSVEMERVARIGQVFSVKSRIPHG
jgi:hypothetical protein